MVGGLLQGSVKQHGGYQGPSEGGPAATKLSSRPWGCGEGEAPRGCPSLARLLPSFPVSPRPDSVLHQRWMWYT